MDPAMKKFSTIHYILITLLFLVGACGQLQAQGKPTILVFGPKHNDFQSVYTVIKSEVAEEYEGDYEVVYQVIERGTDDKYQRFSLAIETSSPKIIILMDWSIELYEEYQTKKLALNPNHKFPPAIACMALLVQDQIKNLKNVRGINYEVPAVTCITEFRDKISVPLNKVGVVYREDYRPFIERQTRYALIEEIELVSYEVVVKGGRNKDKQIRNGLDKALKHLIKKEKVDGIWIVNDNDLITETLVEDIWYRKLRFFKKPVMVNVRSMLGSELGNFAVLPDHEGIGDQVSYMVFDILEGDGSDISGVEEPTNSPRTFLYLPPAERYFGFKKEKEDEIDQIIREEKK